MIHPKAVIGAGAVIREGAFIRAGAVILTILAKYDCNIVPMHNGVNICIGCECLPMDEYIQRQDELADKHDRIWWDETGKWIFDFLCEEARLYEAKGRKREGNNV